VHKVRQRRAVWLRTGIGAECFRTASTPDSAAFAAGLFAPDELRGIPTQHSRRKPRSLARPRKPIEIGARNLHCPGQKQICTLFGHKMISF
jgi:hypothetical protein